MSKKKIEQPLFLEFVNLPFYETRTEILEDKIMSGDERHDRYIKAYILNVIKERYKKGNLPTDHSKKLIKIWYRLQNDRDNLELNKIRNEYEALFDIFSRLLRKPTGMAGKNFMLGNVLTHTYPTLRWKSYGGLEFVLSPKREFLPTKRQGFSGTYARDSLYGLFSIDELVKT